MNTTKTTGQQFTDMIRKSLRMNSRTLDRRDGGSIKTRILESIQEAVQYEGYYGTERTNLSRAAFGPWMSYQKHVDGYRIDGALRYRITSLSPWAFAAFIGDMIDAGVQTTGDGEIYFNRMAHQIVA